MCCVYYYDNTGTESNRRGELNIWSFPLLGPPANKAVSSNIIYGRADVNNFEFYSE